MSNTNQTTQPNSKEDFDAIDQIKTIDVDVENKKIDDLEIEELETQPIKSLILDFLNNEKTQKTLLGLNFWLKFSAITMWIGSALLFILGLIGLIYIFGPLVYWPIAGFNVWLGIILWQISEQIKPIANSSNQDDFNKQIIIVLSKVKQYFQIQGWLTIIGIIFGSLLLIVLFGAVLLSINTNGGFKMDDMQKFNYISSFYI